MKRKHIVIVEDEEDILEVIEYNLLRDGYRVSAARNGSAALTLIRRERPDLVLLDLMLPEVDGLELCRTMRTDAVTRDIPIIMVTAKGEESDVVLGLGLGADDYVTKPFSPRELAARVRVVLRRAGASSRAESGSCIVRGELTIDAQRFVARLSGRDISLTTTGFRILYALASQPGRALTREQLLRSAVGEHVVVLDRNIDVHIRAIRKSLAEYRYLVETVRGVGYRFRDSDK